MKIFSELKINFCISKHKKYLTIGKQAMFQIKTRFSLCPLIRQKTLLLSMF
jgi:hypothetical protein